MSDRETISAYNHNAEAYADMVEFKGPSAVLLAFIARFDPDSYILDVGCGPANSSAVMRDHGLRVDPIDASQEMVRLANELHDIGARQADFSEVSRLAVYHGIWASFSLLHAPRQDFADHLRGLRHALIDGGFFFMGMKLGTGSARDRLGRFYTYYTREELLDHLGDAGFVPLTIETGEDLGLAGDIEPWITVTSTTR